MRCLGVVAVFPLFAASALACPPPVPTAVPEGGGALPPNPTIVIRQGARVEAADGRELDVRERVDIGPLRDLARVVEVPLEHGQFRVVRSDGRWEDSAVRVVRSAVDYTIVDDYAPRWRVVELGQDWHNPWLDSDALFYDVTYCSGGEHDRWLNEGVGPIPRDARVVGMFPNGERRVVFECVDVKDLAGDANDRPTWLATFGAFALLGAAAGLARRFA